MTLLTRYILRQIWAPALLGALVTSFLIVGNEMQGQMKELFRAVPIAQVTVWDISEAAFYVVPVFAGFIIPVTFLMGLMMTFGRLAQNSELVAMKAAGIPLKRLILPVIVAGAALSLFVFWVQDQAQPWAFRRLQQLMTSELPLRVQLDLLPTGAMHAYGGWRVYLGRRDADGTLRDVVVMAPQEGGRAQAFYAEAARVVRAEGAPALQLEHGHYISDDAQGRSRHITFERMTKALPALEPREFTGERKTMTLMQLLALERATSLEYAQTRNDIVKGTLHKDRIEIANRFGFPLMCLAVTLAAAPLGARTRRTGRSYTFASGLLIVIGYYILREVLEPNSIKSLGETILRGQAANILLASVGGFSLWRVDRI